MVRECYIFDTEEECQAALDDVAKQMGCPITARNALTGELDESAQKTERWDVIKLRDTDKKYYCEQLQADIKADLPPEKLAVINTKYEITKQIFLKAWEPVKEGYPV